MSPPPISQALSRFLDESRSEFAFSGYQLYASKGGRTLDLAGGVTSYWPHQPRVDRNTLFDIGSLTKVVATVSTVARLTDRGEINLDAALGERVLLFQNTLLGNLTLREILTHSAGLAGGWFPIYQPKPLPLAEWFVANKARALTSIPRSKTVYSDLGFLCLGLFLQAQGISIDQLFEREVKGPLNLSQVMYGPLPRSLGVAATEYCLDRGRVLQGEVFDQNCAYLGGKAAHAGLFASAQGLGTWCEAWLKAVQSGSEWMSRPTALEFIRRAHLVKGSTWAMGWDTPSEKGSSAGEKFSRASFGHLGYTGCSVWIDPESGSYAVFLSNRVHPSRRDERIRKIRPRVHDLLYEWFAARE